MKDHSFMLHPSSFRLSSALSIRALAAVVAVLGIVQSAQADSATWTGLSTDSSSWTTANNWSTSPVPGNTDTATFNSAGNGRTLISFPNRNLLGIVFDTSDVAAYTIGSSPGNGNMTMNSSPFPNITINATVTNNQTINVNLLPAGNTTFRNNSTNATLHIAGNIALPSNVGNNRRQEIDGAGDILMSGNISNGANANGRILSLRKQGAGTLTLSGSNSYTGSTTLVAGTLLINGNQSGATGDVSVASGSTLGGTGTIGGATTIDGIHSPGNSPGIQTFNNGLTYSNGASVVWELIANSVGTRGTAYDGVDVNGGTLNFAGTTTLDLTFNLTNPASAVNWSNSFWGGAYTGTNGWLVYDAATPISGFTNLVLSSSTNWIDSFGNSLTTVRGTNSYFTLHHDDINHDIYLNLVPEPSTYALLVLAAAGLGAHVVRRRRRR